MSDPIVEEAREFYIVIDGINALEAVLKAAGSRADEVLVALSKHGLANGLPVELDELNAGMVAERELVDIEDKEKIKEDNRLNVEKSDREKAEKKAKKGADEQAEIDRLAAEAQAEADALAAAGGDPVVTDPPAKDPPVVA